MSENAKSLSEQRAELAEQALDETIQAVKEKGTHYRRLAKSQRRKYAVAKALAVVLSVITPTFVAFQTQQSYPQFSLLFTLLAIGLTTGTGIVAGLQAAFKWGEGFGRSTTSTLQLDELAGSIQLESLLYRTTPDHDIKYKEMSRLHDKAWKQLQQIIRIQTQAEIADVSEIKERKDETTTEATKALPNPQSA